MARKIKDIFQEVEAKLPVELMAEFDYWGPSYPWEKDHQNDQALLPEFRWIAIHYVSGGSEGYYVHVATIAGDGAYEIVWMAKTLHEGQGRYWCRKLVAELEDIIQP